MKCNEQFYIYLYPNQTDKHKMFSITNDRSKVNQLISDNNLQSHSRAFKSFKI